jgi:hypothetical protein
MTILNNPFFSGFSITIDDIKVALAYMNAFKAIDDYGVDESKETRRALKLLFTEHAVVIGDMNSSPFAIQKELNTYGLTRQMHRFPTYLFPAFELQGATDIPCFDNVIWDTSQVKNLITKPLVVLPIKVSHNPRDLIEELGLVSDHVPIEITFSGISMAAFNVADPILWSQYYPSAGQGFTLTLEAEKIRQDKLLALVTMYKDKYDVVFLQEVPSKLANTIKHHFPKCEVINMQSSVELEEPSKLVLLKK